MFAYTTKQFNRLLEAVDKYDKWQFRDSSYYRDRDKIMIKMAFYLGLREAEVAFASVDCIDFENRIYTVYDSVAKKGSGGFLPIPEVFFRNLCSYVEKYNLTGWLFLSRSRNFYVWDRVCLDHISPRAVGFRFEKYRCLAGLDFVKNFSKDGRKLHLMRFHDLRGTFATRLDEAGVRLKIIQNLLRHKHLYSTQRYLSDSKFGERVEAVNSVFV